MLKKVLAIDDNPADADDYVIKPVMPEFLARKIKLYLGME